MTTTSVQTVSTFGRSSSEHLVSCRQKMSGSSCCMYWRDLFWVSEWVSEWVSWLLSEWVRVKAYSSQYTLNQYSTECCNEQLNIVTRFSDSVWLPSAMLWHINSVIVSYSTSYTILTQYIQIESTHLLSGAWAAEDRSSWEKSVTSRSGGCCCSDSWYLSELLGQYYLHQSVYYLCEQSRDLH